MASNHIIIIILILFIIIGLYILFTTKKEPFEYIPEMTNNSITDQVNLILQRKIKELDIPGILVGISIAGQPVVSTGIGNVLYGEKIHPDMSFRMGSITKSFIGFLLLKLTQEGYLSFNDKLSKWYPEIPQSDLITLEMLANMTSGIENYSNTKKFGEQFTLNPFRQFIVEELIQMGASAPRLFSPGSDWSYSNTNYVLLGRIYERVLSLPLSTIIKNKITDKFNLTNTYLPTDSSLPVPFVHGFCDERDVFEEATFWNPSWAWAAGGMITKIADLARWAEILGTGSSLSIQLHQQQLSNKTVKLPPFNKFNGNMYYGIGIIYNNGWVGHNGGLPGYNSACYYNIASKIAIVININKQSSNIKKNLADSVYEDIVKELYPNQQPLSN